MPNDYYTGAFSATSGKARASQVEAIDQAVESAFDKLPTPRSTGDGFTEPVHVGAPTESGHAARLADIGTGTTTGTSTSSVSIGTGSKSFTIVESNRGWGVGTFLGIYSAADTANFMQGSVTAYSGSSLTVNVTKTGGSGSAADWTIGLAVQQTTPVALADGGTGGTSQSTAFTSIVAPGGTMTGVLNEFHGADIASASTINLTTATGNLVDVTGTTSITAVTLADGAERVVRFTGALTLTHGSNLVLPGAANITTAAGDFAVFRGYASSVVRCTGYFRADGTAVVGPAVATQAQMEAGSSNVVYVTPGRQHYHPSAAKGWVKADVNGNATNNYNVTSVTDSGTGDITINWATDFSSANFACVTTLETTNVLIHRVNANAAGTTRILAYDTSAVSTDPTYYHAVGFGDHA